MNRFNLNILNGKNEEIICKKEEIKCLGTFDKLNVLIKKLNV